LFQVHEHNIIVPRTNHQTQGQAAAMRKTHIESQIEG
jgi:hypothetical protein